MPDPSNAPDQTVSDDLRTSSVPGLVREARRLAGQTQAGLAARAGVRQSAVSAFEKGRREPSLPVLRRLVQAAGYSLELGLTRPDPAGRRLVGPVGSQLLERLETVLEVLGEAGLGRVWVVGDVARGLEGAAQRIDLVAEHLDPHGRGLAQVLGHLSLLLRPAVTISGADGWRGADGMLQPPPEAVELTEPRFGRRVAVVTGASRAQGIGAAVVRRLVVDGFAVLVHGWEPHDAEQPWGADTGGAARLVADLAAAGHAVALVEADLLDPLAPEEVLRQAVETFGRVDALVANHARSSSGGLVEVDATELDRSFAVNARATALLVQSFAAHAGAGGGRVVLFTSGQHHGGMSGELAYVASKGAVHQLTATLAVELAARAITVNCVDPGPTDTGWADAGVLAEVAASSPSRRWGTPDDAARLVSWLAGRDSAWVTGQVISSDGGWSCR